MNCLDLDKLFGGRFKLSWDESREGMNKDPFLRVLLCRYGEIYPYGGEYLGLWVKEGCSRIAGMIKNLDFIKENENESVQDGDGGELTVLFTLNEFDLISEIVQPRKKRLLGDEHKQKLMESNIGFRFKCSDFVTKLFPSS